VVHGGVHNPAARLSDPSDDSYCCANADASAVSPAYPRADADTYSDANYHADTTAGVNAYACSYSYSCTNSNPYTDSHADSYANAEWRLMVSDR
jgi:hypothetical protein